MAIKASNGHYNLANHCYHGAKCSHKGNYNVRCWHDEWSWIGVGVKRAMRARVHSTGSNEFLL